MNARGHTLNLSPRLMGMALTVLALVASFFLSQAIANADYQKLGSLVAFAAILTLSLFILNNWRIGIYSFFFWILFEDFFRKWMGNELIVYFVKDILIGFTYVSYLLHLWRFKQQGFKTVLGIPLLLLFIWACVMSFNPSIPDALTPLVGLRMSFLYVPLLYLGYSFSRDEKELSNFCILTLSLALVISVLGITQSIVGLEFLNPESAPLLRLSLIRTSPGSKLMVPRPTSTFVDAGRFAQYVFVIAYLGFGLLTYLAASHPSRPLKLRMWVVCCWIVVVLGLFISGQRAVIVWLLLSLPLAGVAYVYGRDRRREPGQHVSLAKLVVLVALALCGLSTLFPNRFRAIFDFYERTINPSSQYSELGTRPGNYWDDIVRAFQSGGLIGHGTGTASLGLQYIASYQSGQVSLGLYHVEGGYASVLWEWGIVGLCLWLLWSVLLICKLVRKVRVLRSTRFYWLGVSITLYAFFLLFPWFYLGIQVYQQYVAQAFLWLLAGMVFRLPFAPQQDHGVGKVR